MRLPVEPLAIVLFPLTVIVPMPVAVNVAELPVALFAFRGAPMTILPPLDPAVRLKLSPLEVPFTVTTGALSFMYTCPFVLDPPAFA